MPTILDRLRGIAAQTEEQIEQQKAALERQHREARDLQRKYSELSNAAEAANEQLRSAEQQFAGQQVELKNRLAAIADGWGSPSVPNGPTYAQIVAIRAAVEDFPRVRAILATRFNAAQALLAEFEKKHGG